jgi:hypothetical protein
MIRKMHSFASGMGDEMLYSGEEQQVRVTLHGQKRVGDDRVISR